MKNTEEPLFKFKKIKQRVKEGELIVSTIDGDGIVWTAVFKRLPIFNFEGTKIFEVKTTGTAEINGVEKGDELYFSISGVRVKQIYDY